jgi:hypothetical protein
MTYGNGSVADNRVMQGAQTNNQCYFKNAALNSDMDSYTYNRVRQIVGDSTIATSATYANSSFTIFIRFNQKDGITVADVNGSFNGTNLTADSPASKGSGTISYDKETGAAKPTVTTPGTTNSNFTSSALQGGGSFNGNIGIKDYVEGSIETGDIIPEGGVYYVKVTSINVGENTGYEEKLVAGDPFPKTVNYNDVFVFGDYEYRYGNTIHTYDNSYDGNRLKGWGAIALDKTKQEYEPLLSKINGQDLVYLGCTYASCKQLNKAPTIPESVTYMVGTFYHCEQLKIAPTLPPNVDVISAAFYHCSNLTQAPAIPQTVTAMLSTFTFCKSLTVAPVLPSSLTHAENLFCGCYNLKTYVGNSSGNFDGYIIPATIDIAKRMFDGCVNIQGNITIHGNPSVYDDCFKSTNTIFLNGQSTILNELAATDGYTDLSVNDKVRVSGNISGAKIPVGGTYYVGVTVTTVGDYTGATKTYQAGSSFPSTVSTGDVYVYGDYEYRYNAYYFTATTWVIDETQNGWGVRALSRKEKEYSAILPSVNGKPITNLHDLFAGCPLFTTLPSNFIIPDTVTVTESMFYGCAGLTTLPDGFTIPSNVKNVKAMFYACTMFSGEIIINANPSNTTQCFYGASYPILITGNSTKLAEIAATDGYSDLSNNDKVRIK